MSTIDGIDHYTIRAGDIQATVRFYVDILGLRDGARPPFASAGAWLYGGDAPIVHLVGADGDIAAGTGPIDHIAFSAHDYDGFTKRLRELKIPHDLAQVPDRALRQIFLTDPNGIKVELTFARE